ncbi:MAG TPA: hypothetical protein VGO93_28235 [Candidatus Xenobia bacterium]|jgi:hypothetical protein
MSFGMDPDSLVLIAIYACIGLVALGLVSGLMITIVSAINDSPGHAATLLAQHPWDGAHEQHGEHAEPADHSEAAAAH